MPRIASLALFAFVVLAAGCGKKPAPSTPAPNDNPNPGGTPNTPASDKDRFQGVWKGESSDSGTGVKETNGERAPRLQVEGDRVSLRESATDPGEPFAATWDTAKNPKTLTLVPASTIGKPELAGATQVWIYKFEGDVLVVAFTSFPGTQLIEFKADKKTGVNVIRFKKTDEKPVAQPPKPTGSKIPK